MNRCKRIALVSGLIALGVAIVVWVLRFSEPHHQGKSLTHWIFTLQTGDLREKREAAEALQAMGELAVPYLIKLVESRDPAWKKPFFEVSSSVPGIQQLVPSVRWKRIFAVKALGVIGPAAHAAVPALTAASSETDASLTTAAKGAVIRIRQESLAPLLDVLNDFSNTNWSKVAMVVAELGNEAKPTVPILLRALQSTNHRTRFVSAHILGLLAIEAENCVPALISSLSDSNPLVRLAATGGLGDFREQARPAIPSLLESLGDSDQYVRWQALFSLSRIVSDEDANIVCAAVAPLTNDPVPTVCHMAGEVLAKFHPKERKPSGSP